MLKSLFSGEGDHRIVACGVEAGITLIKVAVRDVNGRLRCFFVRYSELDSVVEALRCLNTCSVGVTGCGSEGIKRQVGEHVVKVNEFLACGTGARSLMRTKFNWDGKPFILVDIGTGTSIILVEERLVRRIGGTALGGGTILGLGSVILGRHLHYDELGELAAAGQRSKVDMQIHDVYGTGEINLNLELTASNFGKVALNGLQGCTQADFFAGMLGVVGENIFLLANSYAEMHDCQLVCITGATLRRLPQMVNVLSFSAQELGKELLVLPHCEYLGALGAMELSGSVQPKREVIKVGGD